MPIACKRLRSKCSKSWASPVPIPAKANEALVHHIIISEPGEEVLPHSLWLDVLSSYVPMPQIVWMYEDIKLPPIANLRKCDASCLIEAGQARWLMKGNTPLHVVKDLLSMKALSRFGGLYTDLDVFGLGFAWGELVPEGILLCKEPDVKNRLQREYECVSLAMIGLPAGCKILEDCLALIMEKWTRHTTAVLAGDKQRVDWSKRHRDWMFNTKTFSLALKGFEIAE